jgi:CRP-like cAMP-binding protein
MPIPEPFPGEEVFWLERAALLQGLPPATLRGLAAHARELRLADRQRLHALGEPADSVAVVVAGQILLGLSTPQGKGLIIARRQAGQSVGILALAGQSKRKASAWASGAAKVLVLGRELFAPLAKEPVFLKNLVACLAHCLEEGCQLLEDLCLCSLDARLARHFLGNLQEGPEGHWLALPAGQEVLAQMLNVSRPKLNGKLQDWQKAGLVLVRHNRLHVNDLAEIRKRAQLPWEACRMALGG